MDSCLHCIGLFLKLRSSEALVSRSSLIPVCLLISALGNYAPRSGQQHRSGARAMSKNGWEEMEMRTRCGSGSEVLRETCASRSEPLAQTRRRRQRPSRRRLNVVRGEYYNSYHHVLDFVRRWRFFRNHERGSHTRWRHFFLLHTYRQLLHLLPL
jgi:hypothetical protein